MKKINGKIQDINCKVERIKQDLEINASSINSHYEQLLALERYSRGFNLRFYKIPEQTDEDCIDTLENIILNDLNLEAAIENAHRIGPSREDGSLHPIIAKFLYRLEYKYNIIRNLYSAKTIKNIQKRFT